jgi:hypothetical protein
MSAIFPSISLDRDALLNELFLPYQVSWILAEDEFHARKQQVRALAEKSVRIGWTFADAFKNVRKRLRFRKRDYLFATKDYPSALEYMRLARDFTELFNFTKAIVSHGEDFLKINRLNPDGRSSVFSDEIKISYIKFDNGSRIIAFSAHPQAMAVYGGDVSGKLLKAASPGLTIWPSGPPTKATTPSSTNSPNKPASLYRLPSEVLLTKEGEATLGNLRAYTTTLKELCHASESLYATILIWGLHSSRLLN